MLRIKRNHKFMPAFLKTLFYPTISLTILLLVGCSRDNPLNVPDEYTEPDEIICAVTIPELELLTDITITDTELSFPSTLIIDGEEVPVDFLFFSPDNFDYTAEVGHLINSVVITPVPLDKLTYDLAAFNDQIPTGSEPSVVTNAIIGIDSISSIEVKLNGIEIDPGNINSTIALLEESTTVTILVRAKYEVRVNEPDKDGICAPVFTKDTDGDTTEIQETVQEIQLSTYTIEIDYNSNTLLVSSIELSSDISATDDEFGHAISLGRSFVPNPINPPTIGAAIGVPHATISTEDSGAIYFYDQVDNNFGDAVLISAANADPGDLFGYSVSLSDGFIAVSAPGEDSFSEGIYSGLDSLPPETSNAAESSGAVYLFEKNLNSQNDEWRQTTYIKQPSIQLGLVNYDIGFGKKVLIQGNLLLIAAPQQKVTTEIDGTAIDVNSGAVYVYRYSSSTWNLAATLQSETAGSNDGFGSALSIHDGYILVGAPNENNGAGGAHLFAPSGGSWLYSAHLTASNSNPGDAFGTSVAMGSTKIFVGARLEDSFGEGLNRNKADNSLENSGAVYGFSIDELDDPWIEFVYIKADTPLNGAQFGYDIKFEAGSLIIGEPFRSNENSQGQFYIYKLNEKELQQSFSFPFELLQDGISNDNTQMNARFGSSLALFKGILAVGANGFTNRETGVSKTHSGKAYFLK